MPKILVKEFDKTSPGTPGSYANYSVLITGFAGRKPVLTHEAEADATGATKADAIQPDSNGVYEFSAVKDFENTIGLVAPKITKAIGEDSNMVTVYHYGNQMAYELLKLGYSIIFKPLGWVGNDGDGTNVFAMVKNIEDAEFWEIFKDRASYDFRFITHGLLESWSNDPANAAALKTDKTNLETCKTTLDNIEKTLTDNEDTIVDAAYDQLRADVEKCPEWLIYESIEDAYTALNAIINDEDPENAADKAAAQSNLVWLDNFKEQSKTEYLDNRYTTIIDSNEFGSLKSYFEVGEGQFYYKFAEAVEGIEKKQAEVNILLEPVGKYNFDETAFNNANNCIAELACFDSESTDVDGQGRGDCIALIELDESLYSNATGNVVTKPELTIIAGINTLASSITEAKGKFCALTLPSVYYKMAENKAFGNNKKFPGAFHYLACFINSLQKGYAEWYAAAGYNRGVSNYVIDHTSVKLGEIAINALEPRYIVSQETDPKFACNVIANFRGSYYLWGNRTACTLREFAGGGDLVASHFLNIRQLCTTIKKQLYVACRRFTFDPNSDVLWINFVNAISPTLDLMKADQGIRDYRILKVFTDKKATLKARIRIIPIEAVEDFDIEIRLEDSFGETTATVID